jgi:thioredoxin reductase (NADPH)
VYLIHRRDGLRASKVMADRVLANPAITVVWNTAVTGMLPNERGSLSALALDDAPGTGGAAAAVPPDAPPLPEGAHAAARASGARTLPVSGVFLAIGHVPATEFLRGQVDLDADGYVITGPDMATSVPGVWAAGDVQDRRYRQAVTAAGSGCAAALEAERWLALQ